MNTTTANWFHDVASALAYSLVATHAKQSPDLTAPHNDLTQFILTQHAQLPDYLRAPMKLLAWNFDKSAALRGGQAFHRQSAAQRAKHIEAWKTSSFGPQRDFIRYFESLAILALYSREAIARPTVRPSADHASTSKVPRSQRAQIVVIGSGPGGAITACLLAEAGRDVLLLEEGANRRLSSCDSFSRDEMLQKYRNGGQTVALGKNKIAYVEGRCVGGGSEINSGLYHRTPPEILERWRKDFAVTNLTEADLAPHFEQCERDVSISLLPQAAPHASLKLQSGANHLGWRAIEVPRWFRYHSAHSNSGTRQSMTETFIPRFLKAGGKLQSETRVNRLRQNGDTWLIEATTSAGRPIEFTAETLFVCAGAIHTPALLRRSGLTTNIGNSLQVHPTIKAIAEFPETVNALGMGVPVHKVVEFSPAISLGCSISTPAYLALGLIDHPSAAQETLQRWQHRAVYYAAICGSSQGTIRTVPGHRDPLVRYRLNADDRRLLADGLNKLSRSLLAAGASRIFPSVTNGLTLETDRDISHLPEILHDGLANLMTIHLFSSCPMGENRERCATDSYGRVHGFKNLFINDASLLCTAPAVNPQGSIMGIARRNTLHFLRESGHA